MAYEYIISLLFCGLVLYALGYWADLWLPGWEGTVFERVLARLGVGLAFFPVLGVGLDLVGLPLDWRLFGIAAAVCWAGGRYRSTGSARPATRVENLCCGTVLILWAATAWMYIGGAFAYPWLEDGDPWRYAASAEYIAQNKTFAAPRMLLYTGEPYTQGYQILLGVLRQTGVPLYWTVKFYTALLAALSVPLAFLFAWRLSACVKTGLLAAFFLFAVPAWVSHFAFAMTVNMTVFVVALYLAALKDDLQPERTWWVLGASVVAALWLNHFFSGLVAVGLLACYGGCWALLRRRGDGAAALGGGTAAAVLLFYLPAYWRHRGELGAPPYPLGGLAYLLPHMDRIAWAVCLGLLLWAAWYATRRRWAGRVRALLAADHRPALVLAVVCGAGLGVLLLPIQMLDLPGTGSRAYGLEDFFIARPVNMINNPIGLGPVPMGFFCLGCAWAVWHWRRAFGGDRSWIGLGTVCAAVALAGVLGMYFSVRLGPFRMWTFLGIFAAIVAAGGVVGVLDGLSIWGRRLLLGGVVCGCLVWSFAPKYTANTALWPDHMVGAPASRQLYEWMRDGGVKPQAKVLRLCGDSYFLAAYGMSLQPALLGPYYQRALDETAANNLQYARDQGIEYLVAGQSCAAPEGGIDADWEIYAPRLQQRLNELVAADGVKVAAKTATEILLQVD